MKVFLVLLVATVIGLASCEVFYEEKFLDGEFSLYLSLFHVATSAVIYSPILTVMWSLNTS